MADVAYRHAQDGAQTQTQARAHGRTVKQTCERACTQTQTQTQTATRNTAQRAFVLEAVQSLCGSHPTSAQVHEAVLAKHPGVSRATVYRNLGVLAERGEVQRVEVPSGADRYDACLDPHYHVVCRNCGRVADVRMPYQRDIVARVEDADGFSIDHHDIIFEGLCADCRN